MEVVIYRVQLQLAIHLLATNNIIKRKGRERDGSERPGVFLKYIHQTKKKKNFTQRSAREKLYPASLSQPAALRHRDPSPAHCRNNNNSAFPRTPQNFHF